jgi:hypothetical protein
VRRRIAQRLRLDDLLSRLELLPRRLLLPRARSLCASLFWLLARAPRLPASERLMELRPDFEEDDLDDEEERDAIDHSLDCM